MYWGKERVRARGGGGVAQGGGACA